MTEMMSKAQRNGSRRQGRPAGSADSAYVLARGLGWFSIALGFTEVLAPRSLARALGMDGDEALLRAYGVREVATGIGILSTATPVPWIWGRVGATRLTWQPSR